MAKIYKQISDETIGREKPIISDYIFKNEDGNRRFDSKKFNIAEKVYLETIKRCIQSLPSADEYAGEIIDFPVADSQASYMVISVKPNVELMHLEIGDEWDFEYAHLMTAEEVIKKINWKKQMKKIFSL